MTRFVTEVRVPERYYLFYPENTNKPRNLGLLELVE